jgi:hypothetical protein
MQRTSNRTAKIGTDQFSNTSTQSAKLFLQSDKKAFFKRFAKEHIICVFGDRSPLLFAEKLESIPRLN